MATSKNLKVRSVLPIEEIVEINQLVWHLSKDA